MTILGPHLTPDTSVDSRTPPHPRAAGPGLGPNGGLRAHVKDQLLSHQSKMGETRSLAIATVKYLAGKHGYVEIELKDREAGYMLSFEHHNKKGCGGPGKESGHVRVNVYYTTGTVGTSLDHPDKGKTQLFRCEQISIL